MCSRSRVTTTSLEVSRPQQSQPSTRWTSGRTNIEASNCNMSGCIRIQRERKSIRTSDLHRLKDDEGEFVAKGRSKHPSFLSHMEDEARRSTEPRQHPFQKCYSRHVVLYVLPLECNKIIHWQANEHDERHNLYYLYDPGPLSRHQRRSLYHPRFWRRPTICLQCCSIKVMRSHGTKTASNV